MALPRIDLLVVFGTAAQFNWYPDAKARNVWDIDGTLHVQDKANELWKAGYRCALVPDTKISDGVLKFKDGMFDYNGHAVRHCIYLYPKSAIPGGALASDGSFVLASRGIIDGRATDFDFAVDGVRYTGRHTGLLAYRKGSPVIATPGYELRRLDCEGRSP